MKKYTWLRPCYIILESTFETQWKSKFVPKMSLVLSDSNIIDRCSTSSTIADAAWIADQQPFSWRVQETKCLLAAW